MKPNTFVRRHTFKIAILGSLAFAVQVACSDSPVTPSTGGFSGSTSTAGTSSTAGTPATGGTPGTAGASATAGTFSTTAGTFGTAGTDAGTAGTGGAGTAGTGGAGTAGTGTAGTGTAGSGGTGVVPPLDCTNTGKALPVTLASTWAFPDSGDDSYTEAPVTGGDATCTAAAAPNGATGCWSMAWTPVKRAFVHWYWHNSAANWTGQGVCIAAGAKAVTLKAKAAAPVTAEFQAAGVKQSVNLTTQWQDVVINLPTDYNTLNAAGGVNTGLVVVMVRDAADTTPRTIYFYDVEWVASVDTGAGGAGGAGP